MLFVLSCLLGKQELHGDETHCSPPHSSHTMTNQSKVDQSRLIVGSNWCVLHPKAVEELECASALICLGLTDPHGPCQIRRARERMPARAA